MKDGEIVADRYRLDRKLGEGGMGAVWAATHTVTRKRVAIKVLRAELAGNQSLVERFLREARAACAVEHPNVVQIHDVLQMANGVPMMVMDFLDGESLADRLARDGRLPVPELARILVKVLPAVAAAHAAGVVHRDLKPDNLFVCRTRDGSVDLRVLDFGIAKVSATDDENGIPTRTGAMVGTPFYMAPEQLFGEKDVDHRVDIWSLGIIVYECLTGIRPTEADNLGQIIKIVTTAGFPPLDQVAPHVPPDICAVVARMLTPDRHARLADLDAALEVFQRYAIVPSEVVRQNDARPATISGAPTMPAPATPTPAVPDLPLPTGPDRDPHPTTSGRSQWVVESRGSSPPSVAPTSRRRCQLRARWSRHRVGHRARLGLRRTRRLPRAARRERRRSTGAGAGPSATHARDRRRAGGRHRRRTGGRHRRRRAARQEADGRRGRERTVDAASTRLTPSRDERACDAGLLEHGRPHRADPVLTAEISRNCGRGRPNPRSCPRMSCPLPSTTRPTAFAASCIVPCVCATSSSILTAPPRGAPAGWSCTSCSTAPSTALPPSGGARGDTPQFGVAIEATELSLVPAALLAVTVTLYAMSLASPLITHVSSPVVLHVCEVCPAAAAVAS